MNRRSNYRPGPLATNSNGASLWLEKPYPKTNPTSAFIGHRPGIAMRQPAADPVGHRCDYQQSVKLRCARRGIGLRYIWSKSLFPFGRKDWKGRRAGARSPRDGMAEYMDGEYCTINSRHADGSRRDRVLVVRMLIRLERLVYGQRACDSDQSRDSHEAVFVTATVTLQRPLPYGSRLSML